MSDDTYLRIFCERSELYLPGGRIEIFLEGVMDSAARQRAKKIQQQLADGYLERRIVACRSRIDVDEYGG